MRYRVYLEQDEGGIREAIEGYLESLRKHRDPAPM